MKNRSYFIGGPKTWAQAITNWLGPRAYWLASHRHDTAASAWTVIAMSHRHRHPEQSASWRFAVEKSLQHCRARQAFLLASNETPLGPFLIQAAKRLQIPVVHLHLPVPDESLADWQARMQMVLACAAPAEATDIQLWVSPIDASLAADRGIDTHASAPGPVAEFDSIPLVDRALMALADHVRLISVNPGSKTERLIRQRLADPCFPAASVFVAIDGTIQPTASSAQRGRQSTKGIGWRDPTAVDDLLARGAVGWLYKPPIEALPMTVHPSASDREHDRYSISASACPSTLVPRFAWKRTKPDWSQAWPYLSHCTRARTGAWPDQSQVGYYDSLLAGDSDVEHESSAFETLKRILLQSRLIASQRLKRASQATVSLSEVPLQDLLSRRQFQSHLGRWDWEPYGLSIDRRWIAAHGGRPVLYSSEAKWTELALEDRPFFQPTRDAEAPNRSDWQDEREWRVVGDIHLAEIPFESAFVFVPTVREAAQLAAISRFPMMVITAEC